MLILTRRVSETIIIGDHINITVSGIPGTQVRMAISAPKNVSVHRKEIYQRIQQEKSGPKTMDDSSSLLDSSSAEEVAPKVVGDTDPSLLGRLILTRRVGETIIIGDDIDITILGIKGSQVRLGINAPKSVSVHREEIYQRIQQEKSGDHSPVGSVPTE